MQLLLLFLLLVGPYLLLSAAGKVVPRFAMSPRLRARVGLTLFFLFTAVGHFVRTDAMAEMLPPWVPYRFEMIYVTGLLELLGAVGVWVPGLTRLTGICLILMLIGILPSNVYSAFERVEFGGHDAGPIYLLIRVPFQIFLTWWTYFATGQNWFRREHPSRR